MSDSGKNIAENIIYQIGRLNTGEAIRLLAETYPGKLTFSTSFSLEDQVIAHDIWSNQLPVSVFTLDTGRLFAQTYGVWESSLQRYNSSIKAYYPNHSALEKFIEDKGPNSFYNSTENRKQCCHIRKVEPLQRALAGNKIWITGLRAEHSPLRNELHPVEWDEVNQIIKFHPLLHWTTEEVQLYIRKHNIPYNPLHDQGFVSIGCAPCTRAIKQGEDFRAGRWWWENADKKECGLHTTADSTINQLK